MGARQRRRTAATGLTRRAGATRARRHQHLAAERPDGRTLCPSRRPVPIFRNGSPRATTPLPREIAYL